MRGARRDATLDPSPVSLGPRVPELRAFEFGALFRARKSLKVRKRAAGGDFRGPGGSDGTPREVHRPRARPGGPPRGPGSPPAPRRHPHPPTGREDSVFRRYLEDGRAKKFQTRVFRRPRGALSKEATRVPGGLGVRELGPVKGAAFLAYISRTPGPIFPKLESTVVPDGAFRKSPPTRSNSPGSPSYSRSKSGVPANGDPVGGVPGARRRPGSSEGPRGTSPPKFELSGPSRRGDTGDFLPGS